LTIIFTLKLVSSNQQICRTSSRVLTSTKQERPLQLPGLPVSEFPKDIHPDDGSCNFEKTTETLQHSTRFISEN
jgi:hypothetical protein